MHIPRAKKVQFSLRFFVVEF